MIAPAEPPRFPLLVGSTTRQSPPTVIGEDGVGSGGAPVSRVPASTAVEPSSSIRATRHDRGVRSFTWRGSRRCWAVCRSAVVAQRPDRLTVRVEGVRADRPRGSRSLGVRSRRGSTRWRCDSRCRAAGTATATSGSARLRPVVTARNARRRRHADGRRACSWASVGRRRAWSRCSATVRSSRLFEAGAPPPPPAALTVVPARGPADAHRPGLDHGRDRPRATYLVVVRVNGQQAPRSPTVTVDVSTQALDARGWTRVATRWPPLFCAAGGRGRRGPRTGCGR